jgi:hypothetical protein
MSEEIKLLKLVCQALERIGAAYMLTGSLAANFYATPRMTRDIDIVIEIDKFEISRFCRCFENEFYLAKSAILEAIEYEGMFNIVHNKSVCKIDFIVRKDSSYREIEFQRRRRIELDDMKIWIVSPEDLIISKIYWAKDSLSDLQMKDVMNIRDSVKNLDEKYVSDWVQKLGLNDIYAKVKCNG